MNVKVNDRDFSLNNLKLSSISKMFPQFDLVSLSYGVKEYQFFITGNAETRMYKLHRIINHNGRAIFGDGVQKCKSEKLYEI